MTTVKDVMRTLEGIAPEGLAEEWDNVGLLAGHPDWPVHRVLVALNLTDAVLAKAEEIGAELLITHHPILFAGRKNVREDDPEGRKIAELIRGRRALIAAHTNYDYADPGLNDALADALRLSNTTKLPHGLRMGVFPGTLDGFLAHAADVLKGPLRVRGGTDKASIAVAVSGGAGGEFWTEAKTAGADCFLTGEIRYHDALVAEEMGLVTIEAGHEETEQISVKVLGNGLQNALDAVQYDIMVFCMDA